MTNHTQDDHRKLHYTSATGKKRIDHNGTACKRMLLPPLATMNKTSN
jgi:hypothetical protein